MQGARYGWGGSAIGSSGYFGASMKQPFFTFVCSSR